MERLASRPFGLIKERPNKFYRGFSCLIVCVVYNPPSSDNKAFIEHLITKSDFALLSTLMQAFFFLLRDFNRCPVSVLRRHFSLKQIVKHLIRNSPMLNIILTNMSDICEPHKVIARTGLSDHNSVLAL